MRQTPLLVRAPDLAYVSPERMAVHPKPETGYWEVAPDLVIEIVSPNDTADGIAEKAHDYLQSGVRQVWVIDPRQRAVQVHAPGAPTQIVSGDAILSAGDIAPGFNLQLAELWALVGE